MKSFMAFFTCFTHWNDFHWNISILQSTTTTSNQPRSTSSPTTTKSGTRHRTTSFTTILHGTNSNEEEERTNIHDEFMNDLYKAKQDKLGMMIPKEQAKQAAQALENEFLSAMKQASQHFDEAKKKYGSEGAIQKWKEEWDHEHENQGEEDFEMDLDDDMFQ